VPSLPPSLPPLAQVPSEIPRIEDLDCQQRHPLTRTSVCTLTLAPLHPPSLSPALTSIRYQDEIYKFSYWTATSVSTNKVKKVSRTIFEETADGDYTVQAHYQKTNMAGVDDPLLGIPENVMAEGDYERVSLKWDAPTPGPNSPDFIIISIKDAATGLLVKDHMTTAAKGNVVLPLPTAAAAYTVDMSYLSSAKNVRGVRSPPLPFQTQAALTKGTAACLAGTQFTESLHKSTREGLGDLYQIGVLGTYPTTLTQGQKVRLTFGVVSETATQLMVNILKKDDFTWAAGKIVNVPAKTNKLMNVEFTVMSEVRAFCPSLPSSLSTLSMLLSVDKCTGSNALTSLPPSLLRRSGTRKSTS